MSITITSGRTTVELLARGASVRRLEVTDPSGTTRNVVLGYPDVADYGRQGQFHGATVGRYANRIAGGRFSLDGRQYQIPPNEGENALHGGPDGFDRRDWQVVEADSTAARFALVSPDGDQGFPGRLEAEVAYRLTSEADVSELRIDYLAASDAPTVVNLTNHSYWNLDGEQAGSIDGHQLQVLASGYLPVDEGSIPLGPVEPVDGTPFDWRQGQPIGPRIRAGHPQLLITKGLDHNLVLDGEGLRTAARLSSTVSGLALQVLTDQPGLQVYTGNLLDGTAFGTSGAVYRQGAGIAMETQAFPDSPNHPYYPSTVLRPGEQYRTTTIWRLSAR